MTLAHQLVLADRLNDLVNRADSMGFSCCIIGGNGDCADNEFIEEIARAMGFVAYRNLWKVVVKW